MRPVMRLYRSTRPRGAAVLDAATAVAVFSRVFFVAGGLLEIGCPGSAQRFAGPLAGAETGEARPQGDGWRGGSPGLQEAKRTRPGDIPRPAGEARSLASRQGQRPLAGDGHAAEFKGLQGTAGRTATDVERRGRRPEWEVVSVSKLRHKEAAKWHPP
jgi:hypothetical protein